MPGGAEVARLADELVAGFKPEDPAASVPALLALRGRVATLPSDPVVEEKRRQLGQILQECLGLTVATTATAATVVPGEPLKFGYHALVRSAVPVRLTDVRRVNQDGVKPGANLKPGETASGEISFIVPRSAPISQPYWLRGEAAPGMFRVAETKLIGQPENPPPFMIEYVFDVGGQTLVVPDEPLAAGEAGQPERRLAVISPVSLQFASAVALFTPGAKNHHGRRHLGAPRRDRHAAPPDPGGLEGRGRPRNRSSSRRPARRRR